MTDRFGAPYCRNIGYGKKVCVHVIGPHVISRHRFSQNKCNKDAALASMFVTSEGEDSLPYGLTMYDILPSVFCSVVPTYVLSVIESN